MPINYLRFTISSTEQFCDRRNSFLLNEIFFYLQAFNFYWELVLKRKSKKVIQCNYLYVLYYLKAIQYNCFVYNVIPE